MSTKRLDGDFIIKGKLVSFYNNEETDVNHLSFYDGQGSTFHYTIGSENRNIHLGVKGTMKISRDTNGWYKLISSSQDKHDQITHIFSRVDENGNPCRDLINEKIDIITNNEIDFFIMNGRYSITFEFNLN